MIYYDEAFRSSTIFSLTGIFRSIPVSDLLKQRDDLHELPFNGVESAANHNYPDYQPHPKAHRPKGPLCANFSKAALSAIDSKAATSLQLIPKPVSSRLCFIHGVIAGMTTISFIMAKSSP